MKRQLILMCPLKVFTFRCLYLSETLTHEIKMKLNSDLQKLLEIFFFFD